MLRLRVLAAASFVLLMACSGKKPDPALSSKMADVTIAYCSNGWSEPERAEYYHLPEGSELMPYALLANLNSVKTGKPFLEGMERFGFLPDNTGPLNPYGMPIGLTVSPSRNTLMKGREMVGFNCAACHTGQIHYRGKDLRIDGAPALINLQGYQMEFKESLDATLKDPQKLLALLIAMGRDQKAAPAGEKAQYASDPALQTAAEVKAMSTADPSFHSMSSKTADAAQPAALSFRDSMKSNITFLKARLAYVNHGKLILDGTEPGPGRVDAFGAARNFLFAEHAMKVQSPVSFPFLWNVPDPAEQKSPSGEVGWIHYDGNTNSILERNIGQALGMGAVFDPETFESTLRIGNLHKLEAMTRKLSPPQWPAEMLGPIDKAKAGKGEKIFNGTCAGCHQNRLLPLIEMGTDPNRANSFGQLVGDKSFPDAIAPLLHGLKKRAFEDDGITEQEQAGMDAKTVVWRSTGKYKARQLNGIWATSPYLHNGSVPTLYHLLHPEQRPARFIVGNREYDTEKVGYRSDLSGSGANAWIFDATMPGNSNIGHSGERFGTALSEQQKSDLIEYLKSL
jgi:RoxA-like, cytochrome c-like